MEEICHVFLGHKPSRLAIENRNKKGEIIARDYNHAIEEEAYSHRDRGTCPIHGSKTDGCNEGKTVNEIARHFQRQRALVEFRIKVSRLWELYATKFISG